MCLLDLIEQNHAVGLAAHGLGQLSAFLIAHISRRRSDQTGHGEFLHILAHIDPDHVLLIVKQGLGQSLGQLRLAHAGGSQEQERADGLCGILDPGLGTEDRIRHQLYALILADHPFVKLVLQMQELAPLPLGQPCHRDPGPAGNDPCDLIVGHGLVDQPVLVLLRGLFFHLQHVLQLRQLTVLKLCRFFQVIILLRLLDLPVHILDLFTKLLDLFHRVFFVVPLGLLCIEGIPELRQLLLQRLQPFLAQIVGLLLQCGFLDLHLHDLSALLIQLGGHGIQLGLY